MTTTPTPVERAAAELFDRFDIDADGYVLTDVPEERAGYVEHATAVLAAALDVEGIARVLAEHSDYGSAGSGWTCVCGAPIAATSTTVSDLFRAHQAAALVEHLTGGAR